MLIVGVVITY